ncbi:hypothetical protein LguiB_026485 [Lonicera macranthoides]
MLKNLFARFRRCFSSADEADDYPFLLPLSSKMPSYARRPREKNNQVKAPISRLGGNTFIARQRTNLKDQCNLVRLEGDQEIIEEDAVCEICFNALKVNQEMVKIKCKCKSEGLVHEACATKSNCGVCEQQVEKIHLILLQLPTDDAGDWGTMALHRLIKSKLGGFQSVE